MNEFQASVTLAKLKGEKGDSASEYFLEANEVEVLKFYLERGGQADYSLSPSTLNLYLYKSARELLKIDKRNLTVKIDNQKVNLTSNDLEGFITDGEDNDYLVINFNIIKNLLSEDSGLVTFQYTHDDRELQLFLPYRYGVNLDMAKLNICADGIYQSVANSKLNFTSEGLELVNGGLTISKTSRDENGELIKKDIFYFDKETGNLYIEGDGKFSGELSAATGSFSGEITANFGNIGGFNITKEGIISEDKSIKILRNSVDSEGNTIPSIIKVQNIEIGAGAKITEYLELGNSNGQIVRIQNPEEENNNGIFLSVTKDGYSTVQMTQDGKIKLGSNDNLIIINGQEGTITSNNFEDGLGWSLSSGDSIFNNVVVRGTIKASVLEYGEAQAVGGILIVRPSSIIKEVKEETIEIEGENSSIECYVFTLEDKTGFNEGDYCLITDNTVKNYFTIIKVDEDSNDIYIAKSSEENPEQTEAISEELEEIPENSSQETIGLNVYIGRPIIDLGKGNDNSSIGLGLNGSSNNSLVPANSLSVFEFDKNDKILQPKIILGKIPNDKETYGEIANTYGLYAKNVLLTGSLVTSLDTEGNQYYSGISSAYDAIDGNFPMSDPKLFPGDENKKGGSSEILLWAGALGTSKEEVENSKFYIDRNGNFYASSGYFTGSVITRSTIEAAEIKTAKITGKRKEGSAESVPALIFQDVDEGIVFYKNEKNEETGQISNISVLKLGNDGIEGIGSFKFNENFKIDNGAVSFDNSQGSIIVEGFNIYSKFKLNNSDIVGPVLEFNNRILNFKTGTDKDARDIFKIDQTEVKSYETFCFEKKVKYGEKVFYEPVTSNGKVIGCDLYVME